MGFFVTAQQVVIMFALIGLGVIATRLGWLPQSAITGLTNVVIYFVSPSVIVLAFHRPFDAGRLRDMGIVMGLDLVWFALVIALVHVVFARRLVSDDAKRRTLRYGAIYPNAGFLGIPLAQALLGADGVFFAVAFVVAFNFFVWTQGYAMFPGQEREKLGRRIWRVVRNPNIFALAIGTVIFCTSLKLPGVLVGGLDYLAAMNAPLSMIVIGGSLAGLSLRSFITDRWAWLGTGVRNLLIPLFGVIALAAVPLDFTTRLAILIPVACPVGAFLVMFSVMHRVDTAFPSRLLCLSTVSSVVTLPAILTLASVVW
jgi:predicted permease